MSTEQHSVVCPYCGCEFDLFTASWCEHYQPHPSKMCPSCGECACHCPGYGDPRFWAVAPPTFWQKGFRRLFIAYL